MQHHKFKNVYKRYRIELPRYKKMDVEMYLSKSYSMVKNKIKKALRKLKSIKIQLSLRVKLKKYRQTEDDFVYIKPYFTSEIGEFFRRYISKRLYPN